MKNIKRLEVSRHILVPDTNILWCRDKSFCVDPKFQKFWEKNAGEYNIELVIPSVVQSELQFQQTTSAIKTLKRANDEFKLMSAVAGSKYKHRVSDGRVRTDVERKLLDWIGSCNSTVYPVPLDKIDWERLIHDAIWRKPPFVEEKDNEKGFRDALIVETVASISEENPDIDIAFISGDGLVRDAVAPRLEERHSCFETLDEFETRIKLLDEELTNSFVKVIQNRAREKFHNQKDRNCLVYNEKLLTKIKADYSSAFASPSDPLSTRELARFLSGTTDRSTWEEASRETPWVRAPEFVSVENKNNFHWRSKIIFVQLFRLVNPDHETTNSIFALAPKENLRKIEFSVNWSSKVAINGRFYSLKFINIEEPNTIFESPTDAERETYGLRSSDSL